MTWRHAERRLDVLGLKWGLLALLKRDPRTQSEQNNIAICLTWEVWTERPTRAHEQIQRFLWPANFRVFLLSNLRRLNLFIVLFLNCPGNVILRFDMSMILFQQKGDISPLGRSLFQPQR